MIYFSKDRVNKSENISIHNKAVMHDKTLCLFTVRLKKPAERYL